VEGNIWHADHITPVVEGGGECTEENIRTLCVLCHAVVTRGVKRRRRQDGKTPKKRGPGKRRKGSESPCAEEFVDTQDHSQGASTEGTPPDDEALPSQESVGATPESSAAITDELLPDCEVAATGGIASSI
jgi:hypothetical protein